VAYVFDGDDRAETGKSEARRVTASVAVSVVVPTRRRPESLERCLAALDRQGLDDEFEIVVVADGEDAAVAVAAIVARFPRARLVSVSARGPAAARNAGAHAASGAFVCLTDDDCEPTPSWLSALVRALRRGAQAAAGATTNGRSTSRIAVASGYVSAYFGEHGRAPFAASNNLGCRRELLQAVPFDARYPAPGGEDRDWSARIAARGVAIEYVPQAAVEHRHPLTFQGFLAQQFRYGRGSHVYHRGGAGRPFERFAFYRGLVRGGLELGPAAGLLVGLSQATIAAGFVWEAVAKRFRGR
jgi:cellulose synthase/poly-beta-1,6-N-acetylglucosamine synthase-like glycosyltransferase